MPKYLWLLCCLSLFGNACKRSEKFPDVALNIAGPIDVVTSGDGKYFYVLNTDFDRTYDAGSIVVISESGEKIAAVKAPRMGRSLTISGTDLIATFDKADDDGHNEVHLYDLTDPTQPQLVKRWSDEDSELKLDCTPVNAVMRENYNHFAVACSGGRIFLGTLKTPRAESELVPVRDSHDAGRTRRALYLDPQRELLFAFPTDMTKQETTDFLTKDEKTFDPVTGAESSGPNEIPDEFEFNMFRRKNSGRASARYQYLLYNIAAERAQNFPFRHNDEKTDLAAQKELRWIYFTLKDFDGTPDTNAGTVDSTEKHYRSNFWATQPDPLDSKSFYISHRGKKSKEARFSNNIIKVTMIDDVTVESAKTSDVLKFERVYGFKGELNPDNHFPGDFEVGMVNGQLSLVVNHFKDLVNFRKNAYFSIAATLLPGSMWYGEVSSTSQNASYFQIAMNERGKMLSCSFYSNAVIPLELSPGTAINLGWGDITRIE